MRNFNVKTILKVACVLTFVGLTCLTLSGWRSTSYYVDKICSNFKSNAADLKSVQRKPLVRVERINKVELNRKDWHDYEAMKRDAEREGLGEQGKAAALEDISDIELEQKMSMENGFNALLSDAISLNRSVPDIRHESCRSMIYLEQLPIVSVIIPFYNEHFSVLIRSLYSLVNRSPPELLTEIILVDDCSKRKNLFEKLDQYVAEHFPKVRILRLKERKGLINARLVGARNATAEVFVFVDSHIETNYNWLPPLLEPIALNKRTSVCPFVDVINDKTFEYSAQDEGARGAFDWHFNYKRLPLLQHDKLDPTKPFKNPVMSGGLFAISKDYFWELGGYDEGLDIWGGEQYELSFKIWMCGGELLDAPCSRVAHIYRGPANNDPDDPKHDYLHGNYKRVAEVWMDDYKKYLYEKENGLYDRIEAGDLTKQKALRENLQCKSFQWYMEEVAFDLVKNYPTMKLTNYAEGSLQSLAAPDLCLKMYEKSNETLVRLYDCYAQLRFPPGTEYWILSWHSELRLKKQHTCVEALEPPNVDVFASECHGQGGEQFWYYDRKNKLLRNGFYGRRCLMALPKTREVIVQKCRKNEKKMKWLFAIVNNTALNDFFFNVPKLFTF